MHAFKMLLAGLALACAWSTNAGAVSLGWHAGHPRNCGWLTDSVNDQIFYVSFVEGDFLFTVGNLMVAHGLELTCDSGNFLAWHVVNATTGQFDQTASFTFK
jgi:hypothetical protein